MKECYQVEIQVGDYTVIVWVKNAPTYRGRKANERKAVAQALTAAGRPFGLRVTPNMLVGFR